MIITFKDGVSFDTDGEYRIEKKQDGYYVVGKGMLCPVKDEEEGLKMINDLKGGNLR